MGREAIFDLFFFSSLSLSLLFRRSQHCEVEKRRREKMNRYMSELAQMIPACNAVPRKLDKLSILKMAVDHMKNLRGNVIYTNSCHCFMLNHHAHIHT